MVLNVLYTVYMLVSLNFTLSFLNVFLLINQRGTFSLVLIFTEEEFKNRRVQIPKQNWGDSGGVGMQGSK